MQVHVERGRNKGLLRVHAAALQRMLQLLKSAAAAAAAVPVAAAACAAIAADGVFAGLLRGSTHLFASLQFTMLERLDQFSVPGPWLFGSSVYLLGAACMCVLLLLPLLLQQDWSLHVVCLLELFCLLPVFVSSMCLLMHFEKGDARKTGGSPHACESLSSLLCVLHAELCDAMWAFAVARFHDANFWAVRQTHSSPAAASCMLFILLLPFLLPLHLSMYRDGERPPTPVVGRGRTLLDTCYCKVTGCCG